MCGRYVPPDEAAMERFWRIDRRNWAGWPGPRFNVAPTTIVPIIVEAQDGAYELAGARWGLIPSWWNKDVPPALTFNARSEEAARKPTWRNSIRATRCLMPARGWFEWNEHEPARSESGRKVNQPYFIHSPDAEVIAFAGLWALWQRAGAAPVLSCALLSKQAAPAISGIHHRMPVVLAPTQYAAWLDPSASAEAVQGLIAAAREDFEGYRVSTRVNNTRNDSPDLLVPLPTGEPEPASAPETAVLRPMRPAPE
ncbi:MAG: SOS response-associated peptidase [Betaproteobacteria bacterium]